MKIREIPRFEADGKVGTSSLLSSLRDLKHAPKTTANQRFPSKQHVVLLQGMRIGLNLLLQQGTITELDVFDALPENFRYRRGLCVSIVRELHRRCPEAISMELKNGLWTLYLRDEDGAPPQRGTA